MPIAYEVFKDGHYIHAVASGIVTHEDFVNYEIDHAIDERVSAPLCELLEIQGDSCNGINKDDMERVLEKRRELNKHTTPHKCAIVVKSNERSSWDFAKFYEGMVILHFPENVIVFSDERTAKLWLGV